MYILLLFIFTVRSGQDVKRKFYIRSILLVYDVFSMSKHYNTTVISVRIRKDVKDSLGRAEIDIPKVLKQYLEDLAWRAQLKEGDKGFQGALRER